MKKITLLFLVMLLGITGVKAEITTVELWTGTQATGNWETNVDLSYGNKGKLNEIFMNDKIRITYKDAGEDAKVRVANPDGWGEYEAESEAVATIGNNQTFEYTITSAVILEQIQQNGILGRGKNITITKIELLKVDDRYDAVPVTIGEDGVATFSSSKKLDFSGKGITPYYASAVETGQVTLTSVDNKTTWDYQGYILKGSADTYDIPVINDAFWPSTNFLKPTNDYSAEVAASTVGTYRYIFAKDKSDNGKIAFFKLTSKYTLAAHRAYLETEVTPGARLVLRFEDEDDPTAIGEVKSAAQPVKTDNVYYNLKGQRVEKPTKGIYILNGKKVLF